MRVRDRRWLGACTTVVMVAASTGPIAKQQPTADALFARYATGNFDEVTAILTSPNEIERSVRSFQRSADAWIGAAPAADRSWREAVVATASLDLTGRVVSRTVGDIGHGVRPLIEWLCPRLRSGSPSRFERLFHLAAMSLLQAAGDDQLLIGLTFTGMAVEPQKHILHGATRFPEEGRFKLAWVTRRHEARLLASEPLAPGYLVNRGAGRFEADGNASRELNDTVAVLGKLVDDPGVGGEARLRRGVLRFLMDQPSASAADLLPLATAADVFIRYNARMVLGAIETRSNRIEAALVHYQAAFDAVPAASAAVALAATLFNLGRRSEAAEIVAQTERLPPSDDPWRQYGLCDYRLFRGYLEQMRNLVVRRQ